MPPDENRESPKRRLQFKLECGADSRDALIGVLSRLQFLIGSNQITRGVSGGYDSGYTYELTEDENIDHDMFCTALDEYLAAVKSQTESRMESKMKSQMGR